MTLRPALLVLLVALAAPLASATVGPHAFQAESLSIDDVTITEGDVGAVAATFTVTLSDVSPDTVTVDYATADGTAVAPGDYSAAGGTLTFLPGETTQTVTVDVNGDALDEEEETYTVDLTNAVERDDRRRAGRGHDHRRRPAAGALGRQRRRSPKATAARSMRPSPSASTIRAAGPSRVDYATADGTATAPADYAPTSGTLTFAAGQTTKQVTVLVNGDPLDESDETTSLNLANAINATIADGQGVGTITDDDPPPALSINDVTVTEGDCGHDERHLHRHA